MNTKTKNMVGVGLFTAIVVVLTPMSFLVTGFIAKRTHKYFQQQAKVRGEQTALIDEALHEQKLVQAFGREDDILAQFDEINDRLQKASLRAIFFSSLTNPCTRFVNSVVYAAVALTGALMCIGGVGGFTVGNLTSFLNYANQYTKPFNEISGVVTELQNALACAGRVFELIEAPARTPDPDNPQMPDEDTLEAAIKEAYRLADGVQFEKAYRRSDIGQRALAELDK